MFDPAALGGDGLVVFGTSNCVNDDPTDTEAESEGVYAISATTGALVWEFHPRPFNDVDDDFGASPNLLPGGLVGNGGKDGLYYAFDRLTGRPPWTSHPAQSGHVNPGIRVRRHHRHARGRRRSTGSRRSSSRARSPRRSAIPGRRRCPTRRSPRTPSACSRCTRSARSTGRSCGAPRWPAPSFGAPTYANGIVFVPSTFGLSLQAYDANTARCCSTARRGAPSSSPTIVGDMVFIGTRASTAEGIPAEGQQHGLHAFSIPAAPVVPGAGILLNAQGNQLDAYDLAAAAPTTTRTTPTPSHVHSGPHDSHRSTTPYSGHDVNGQNCAITQADGSVRYLMGEDSDEQAPPHSGLLQGWGLFAPTSGVAGPWIMTDKLVPTYNFTDPPNDHKPDNTGCASSKGSNPTDPADDMLFLVDIGVGAFDVPGVGSLFVYYRDAAGNFSHDSKYCVLDNHLTTAGYIAVDDDGTNDVSVLVPESGRSTGGVISRFSAPFPPPTGSSCSYNLAARKSDFFAQNPDPATFVPISIARRGDKWVVGNVVPPVINEYNDDGSFSRPLATEQPTPGVAGVAVDAQRQRVLGQPGARPVRIDPVSGARSRHALEALVRPGDRRAAPARAAPEQSHLSGRNRNRGSAAGAVRAGRHRGGRAGAGGLHRRRGFRRAD